MQGPRAARCNPLGNGIFMVLQGRNGEVVRLPTERKAAALIARELHGGHYVMLELLPNAGG